MPTLLNGIVPIVFLIGLLSGCDHDSSPKKNRILAPIENKELVVVMRPGAASYFQNESGKPSGFEYDLVQQFARKLKLPLRIISNDDTAVMYDQLRRGQAHVAITGLASTNTPLDLRTGPRYFNTQTALVYNTDQIRPETWSDLDQLTVGVLNTTAAEPWFSNLQRQYPNIQWKIFANSSEEGLLQATSFNHLDFCLIHQHFLNLLRNVYLNLDAAFDVGPEEYLAWTLPAETDPQLIKEIITFFSEIKQYGNLKGLIERHYGHLARLKVDDAGKFQAKITATLPKFRHWFKEAESRAGIDWRLIAAIAYQESQWDPLATSPTNVRGIMMLTEETAEHLGVSNRLDPQQSITAGAVYLQQLKQKLPENLGEPDHTWLALAAYNIGPAHLEDARNLAKKLGLNPNQWRELKKALPLLSQQQHYANLKYGFARGGAAVIFTESVRAYYDLLTRIEALKTPSLQLTLAKPEKTAINYPFSTHCPGGTDPRITFSLLNALPGPLKTPSLNNSPTSTTYGQGFSGAQTFSHRLGLLPFPPKPINNPQCSQ